jgi:guanosine-3',5'-bis(diphosphate) 3'-pyrophosphohydrolase
MTTFAPGTQLNAMLVLTVNNHSNQFDKGGKPYILHTLRVMHRLRTDDEELQCIALGHDVVEDCGVTYAQLAELGFTQRVIDGIRCLTKTTGESYDEYRAKVLSNRDAMRVKLEDLRDNSDIRRLKGVTEKDIQRMVKYHKFYLELKEALATEQLVNVQGMIFAKHAVIKAAAVGVISRNLRVHEDRPQELAHTMACQMLDAAVEEIMVPGTEPYYGAALVKP